MSAVNYYEVLAVEYSASASEIRASHRKLLRSTHPDVEGGSHTEFVLVGEAFRVLSDPLSRARYDRDNGVGTPEYTEALKRAADDRAASDKVRREKEAAERREARLLFRVPEEPEEFTVSASDYKVAEEAAKEGAKVERSLKRSAAKRMRSDKPSHPILRLLIIRRRNKGN